MSVQIKTAGCKPGTPTLSPSNFPLFGLLALATASFLTTLTEALRAGLLPQIGADHRATEAMAGPLITVYALGSLLAASRTERTVVKRAVIVMMAIMTVVGGWSLAHMRASPLRRSPPPSSGPLRPASTRGGPTSGRDAEPPLHHLLFRSRLMLVLIDTDHFRRAG